MKVVQLKMIPARIHEPCVQRYELVVSVDRRPSLGGQSRWVGYTSAVTATTPWAFSAKALQSRRCPEWLFCASNSKVRAVGREANSRR